MTDTSSFTAPRRRDRMLTVSLVVVCQGFNMLTVGGIALFLPLARSTLARCASSASGSPRC